VETKEPPPEQHPATPNDPNEQEGPGGKDAGPKPKPDAGPQDAGVKDAGPKDAAREEDGSLLVTTNGQDASAVALNDQDAAPLSLANADAGLVASAASDAGSGVPGGGGPRTPAEMLGVSNVVTAGQVNVTLLVNSAVIRSHPVGARMGPILPAIPQWAEFMRGAEKKFDPLKDSEWMLIFGPSLINTDRDAIFVRVNVPDTTSDLLIDQITNAPGSRGGPLDAGVRGVHAGRLWADNGDRAVMRVQSHLLMTVPPDKAYEFAKVYSRTGLNPRLRPGEAMRMTVRDPWRQISIPNIKFANSLSELRFWIIPHNDDGSADLYGEGDCGTPEHAVENAAAIRDMVKQLNSSMIVKIATHGLLNGAEIEPANDKVKLHLAANRDQLEAMLAIVGAQFGVNIAPPAPGGGGAPQ
jgi:hypothetical protein